MNNSTSQVIDTLTFHTFKAIVIGLSGEQISDSGSSDALDNGMFTFSERLYDIGYDIHYFNEDEVGVFGQGAAYDEAVAAVQDRFVNDIGIFGHSHGGGSTYLLANRLDDKRPEIGNFAVAMTTYVDAIVQGSVNPETRLPPSTQYHVNYYQRRVIVSLGLAGDIVPGADVNLNVNETGWGVDDTHGTIDDNPILHNLLVAEFENHMIR